MQRWFFADEEILCQDKLSAPSDIFFPPSESSGPLPDTEYKFSAIFEGKLCSNERLAVVGNIDILGNWEIERCVTLKKQEDYIWAKNVILPRQLDIFYRYLIIAIDDKGRKIVRFWETHMPPRSILRKQEILEQDDKNVFGYVNNVYRVRRGWINHFITAVQFKIFNAPIVLGVRCKSSLLYVKITPMRVKERDVCENNLNRKVASQELRTDRRESLSDFAFCEVACLKNGADHFHYQPKYGTPCGSEDILLFNLLLGNFEKTGYIINLYNYPPKADPDIPPYHFGYMYVMPEQLKGSHGSIKVAIMCASKHRPIGSMKFDYIVIHPLFHSQFKAEEAIERNWFEKVTPWHIAHRGCGKSFWFDNDIVRENTLRSFKLAAEHGADILEFDVQLTKDKIPIIHHDFVLKIPPSEGVDIEEYDVFRLPLTKPEATEVLRHSKQDKCGCTTIPIRQFTSTQLQMTKVYEPDIESRSQMCVVNSSLNQPFKTLKKILREVPKSILFNIDIKWPIQLENGNLEHGFMDNYDMNEFVDAILNVIISQAGKRKIILSSFSADVCSMLQLKQNIFPVIYLAKGEKFRDPRGKNILIAALFAHSMEFFGIGAIVSTVLQHSKDIILTQQKDLKFLTWGHENRNDGMRRKLKTLGLDAIVYDRINHVIEPDDLKGVLTFIDIEEEIPNEES